MKMKILMIAVFMSVAGCTTNPHKVEEIDTELDKKGSFGNSSVGLNKDGELIVQEESTAADELRQVQWANQKLEDDMKHEHFLLKTCRNDLADSRLGGSGEVDPIAEVDNLKSASEVREQFGLTKAGEIKFVKREFYLDRLKQERDLSKSLKDMTKTIGKHREACERRMATARVKNGLPAQRYKAQGYFSPNGAWNESRKAENSLDDAFQIKAMEASK